MMNVRKILDTTEMRQKSENQKPSSERIVKDIRRPIRKQYSVEEKIRIVLDGLRGEHSIAQLCRREGIAESLYCNWSKEFLEAGSYGWPEIQHVRRQAARSRICDRKPAAYE